MTSTSDMAARDIRLIFVDVDGTLVGASGDVDPAVWLVAERLRATGVRLAVCTGRPGYGVARGYAERLDADGWHIFQNGASIVDLATGASRSNGLPAAMIPALFAQAEANGLTLELYGDRDFVVQPGRADVGGGIERAARHAFLLGAPYRPHPLADYAEFLGGPVVRAQWLLAHDDAPRVLADPPAGARLIPSSSPMMPDTTFVSVLAPGLDKVVAVRTVAEAYGLPLSAVMFVGDGANDAAALAAVAEGGGLAVAMANAEPEALAVARHVTGHVDEGGLADALALVLDVPAHR